MRCGYTKYILRYSAACCLMLFLSSALCSAQQNCAELLKRITEECYYGTCHGSVTIDVPIGFGHVYYETRSVECCKQLITDVNQNGSCENLLALAGIEEQVERLAAVSDVLVADCAGRYVPYQLSVFARRAPHSATEDRVLR